MAISFLVDGTDLCAEYGVAVHSFSESLPEPKVIKVDIPGGSDLDITEALGTMGWHNGTHVIELLLMAEDEGTRAELARRLVAMLHGRKLTYKMSWDPGYSYSGRFAVELERLSTKADMAKLTIDREPWKRSYHVVDVNCHPSGIYELEGSRRYRSVTAVMAQGGTTKVGDDDAVTRSGAGSYTLASDLLADTEIALTVDDWLMYVDGEDLVVKASKFSTSGTGATIGSTGVVTDGDLAFAEEADQHVSLRYYRWDL